MIYLLDTNIITDLLKAVPEVIQGFNQVLRERHEIVLCQPVHFEVMRGLLHSDKKRQMQKFTADIVPRLIWQQLTDEDSMQASQFWAATRSKGRQLSDIDLLLAALAHRLNATITSSDTDFDALPVRRESWRDPQ